MAFVATKVFKLEIGELTIQSTKINEAQEFLSFIRKVEMETDFLMRVPGETHMTEEDERKFILDKLENPREILLTARYNNMIVGTLGFTSSRFIRYSHKGQFGISILKDFWGLGIGKRLIETLIEWADATGIVKITLEVDTLNYRAIRLYKSMGFFEEGLLKMDRFMENKKFRDSLMMARLHPYYSRVI